MKFKLVFGLVLLLSLSFVSAAAPWSFFESKPDFFSDIDSINGFADLTGNFTATEHGSLTCYADSCNFTSNSYIETHYNPSIGTDQYVGFCWANIANSPSDGDTVFSSSSVAGGAVNGQSIYYSVDSGGQMKYRIYTTTSFNGILSPNPARTLNGMTFFAIKYDGSNIYKWINSTNGSDAKNGILSSAINNITIGSSWDLGHWNSEISRCLFTSHNVSLFNQSVVDYIVGLGHVDSTYENLFGNGTQFQLKMTDFFDGASINSFVANITNATGTTSIATTNGSIFYPSTQVVNISVFNISETGSGFTHFNQTKLNVNTSSHLTIKSWESVLIINANNVTPLILFNVTLTQATHSQFNTSNASGNTTFYLRSGLFTANGKAANLTFNSSASFTTSSLTTSTETLVFGSNQLNLSARNYFSNVSIDNFTVSVMNLNTSVTNSITTTTGLAQFLSTPGEYQITYSSTGYAIQSYNVTLENLSQNHTAFLFENNSIYVRIFDSSTNLLLTGINFTVTYESDAPDYFLESTTLNGTFFKSSLPANTYSVQVGSSDYPTQLALVTVSDSETKTVDFFMTNSTSGSDVFITIVDSSGNAIEGAIVTIQEKISGIYTTISQKTTDSTGAAYFFLRLNIRYRVLISSLGYVAQTAFVEPSADPYNVQLAMASLTSLNSTLAFNGLDGYSISPSAAFLDTPGETFTLTISSALGKLNHWGVFFNSSEIVNFTTATGGVAELFLNLSNLKAEGYSLINLTFFYKTTSNSAQSEIRQYRLSSINQTNTTIKYILEDSPEAAQFSFMQKIGVILLLMFIGFLVAWELSFPKESYLFIAMTIIGLFMYIKTGGTSWIPAWLGWPLEAALGIAAFAQLRGQG